MLKSNIHNKNHEGEKLGAKTNNPKESKNAAALKEQVTGNLLLNNDISSSNSVNASARNSDTRERILNAAELLFMENGYDATSMRHITKQAGVNLAAVNYHFGSKEALIQDVFRRRLEWLNVERLRVLGEMEAAANGAALKPSQIVDALFGTLLRMADDESVGGPTFVKLLGRTLTDPTKFINTFLAREHAYVMDRFKEALFKALPDVPKSEIIWRFHFMLGATSYAIAGTDVLSGITDWQLSPKDRLERPDLLLPRLMTFLLGGLRAPLPQFPEGVDLGEVTNKNIDSDGNAEMAILDNSK